MLAACGGAAKPVPAATTSEVTALSYGECMRVHGVPSFPGASAAGVQGLAKTTRRAPSFISAETVCAGVAPAGSPERHISATDKLDLLAAARCMRSHGASDVPDPTFRSGGVVVLDMSGTGNQAPSFRRAVALCHYPAPQ